MSVPFAPPPPLPVGQRLRRSLLRQWPQILVLAGVAAALAVVALHHFRRGTFILGACLLMHAVLRAGLSERRAGWLAVRSRAVDVLISVAFGAALIVLAIKVPAPS